jgi:hypothetical protein
MTTPLYSNRQKVPAVITATYEIGVQIPPEGDFVGQSYDVLDGLVVVCPADSPCPPLAVGDVWTFLGSSYTIASIQLYGSGTVPAATVGTQAGPDAVTFTSGAVASVATLLASGKRTFIASKIQNPYVLH